jgi:hypothetical protein
MLRYFKKNLDTLGKKIVALLEILLSYLIMPFKSKYSWCLVKSFRSFDKYFPGQGKLIENKIKISYLA